MRCPLCPRPFPGARYPLALTLCLCPAPPTAALSDVTKYFLEHDAKQVAVETTSLPLKVRWAHRGRAARRAGAALPAAPVPLPLLTPLPPPPPPSTLQVAGRIGEHLAELYSAGQKGKNFDKLVKDLEGVTAAIKSGGLVVERFFSTANYSPVECKKVVELLLTAKEPLTAFKDIKDEDVREILVDNEANLAAWLAARKAIAAIGLSDPVKALLEKLAGEGRLERVKKLAAYAAELKNVTLKTTDAIVTSAVPLSKAQQEAIAKALPTYVPAGMSVNPIFSVDAAIIGGLTITMRNVSIDLSANSRMVEVVSGSA